MFKEELDMKTPNHVALIVDGNRRWARQQNMPFFDAYKLAGLNLVDIVCNAATLGIKSVTAFLFSTENWKRDCAEIDSVMKAFGEILFEHTETFKKCGVRVHTIGGFDRLPSNIQKAIRHTASATRDCDGANFVMAFNYGGRWDVVEAVKRVTQTLSPDDINRLSEHDFASLLSTAPFGDPDLLIRTGDQRRISNFMMWQLAYAELYFSELMWPDFTPEQFKHALCDFDQRERRKGA